MTDRIAVTPRAAGQIARAAQIAQAVPFHFSPRHLGRDDELRREFFEALLHPEGDRAP